MSSGNCSYCGRPFNETAPSFRSHRPIVGVYVVHDFYGCDTGCCGHKSVAVDSDGDVVHSTFHFDHPSYEDDRLKWASDLSQEDFPQILFLRDESEACPD